MNEDKLPVVAETDIVEPMEYPIPNQKHVVIAYPSIGQRNLEAIQAVRKENDPQFEMVNPHITLVFPFSAGILSQDNLVRHVKSVLEGASSVKFTIERAIVERNNSDFQVHLLVAQGASEIIDLHDKLYTGPLIGELRRDLGYVPHITIASGSDESTIHKLAATLNSSGVSFSGVIETVTVGSFDGQKVTDISSMELAD